MNYEQAEKAVVAQAIGIVEALRDDPSRQHLTRCTCGDPACIGNLARVIDRLAATKRMGN